MLLALLPLVFTGKAFLRGGVYGPADMYFLYAPWKAVAAENGVGEVENPILSDLAFANIPWRAAVREAVVNGRVPLWNRFVLGGNPLLGSAQAGVFHPATWLGLGLPLAQSWTFSCAFTIFLALVAGYLFFRELSRHELAALVGAVGWGFSTFLLFWAGWAVGPSLATFPLLLLGLRRLARGGENAFAITTVALLLSVLGGHPETLLHSVAAGGVYFLSELFARDARRRRARAIGASLFAGLLAATLAAPALLPLLEAIPQSTEYAARRAALTSGRGGQSVAPAEAARRTRPALLPFAHGIYGRSPVQEWRQDGSGMPLAYAGALLFPLALLGLGSRERTRWIFVAFLALGLLYGASAPLLLNATAKLPGFALALNYRLVFLAPLGLAGLAALGVDRVGESPRTLAVAAIGAISVLVLAYVLAVPVFRERGLTAGFTRPSMLAEAAPLVLLVVASLALPRGIAAAALVLLVAQRFVEMCNTYPTLPARAVAPPVPVLASLPRTTGPYRIVGLGDALRPNGSTPYGLEDARGYESLVLRRFAETWPLWCRAQTASFNRVDGVTSPFLEFLNVRYAIADPSTEPPPGWTTLARGSDATVFENPRALPRAFVPERIRVVRDGRTRLEEMRREPDFSRTAWVADGADEANGRAVVGVGEVGPDLVIRADVSEPALVATSLPDWKGWRAESDGREIQLTTVNHAFVGFRLPPGRHTVRLRYLPDSFVLGVGLAGVGVLAAVILRLRR